MEENSNKDIDLDEVMPSLIASGFPTFDEFRKNPDKYRKRPEEIFESVDQSSHTMRPLIKRQRYMWKNQYTVRTLEELQKIVAEEGFTPNDLQMRPIVKPIGGTSRGNEVEIVIQFWPEDEFYARGYKGVIG